jgi:hypothetical protein
VESGADRWPEANPDDAASLTIVVVSADPIVGAGLQSILQPTGARLELVGAFGQAIDLILGSSSLADPLVVVLYLHTAGFQTADNPASPTAVGLDVLLFQQLQRRIPPVPVLAIGQGEPPPPLPGLSILWGMCSPDRLRDAVSQLAQGQAVWWVEGALQTARAPLDLAVAPLGQEPSLTGDGTPRDWVKQWLQKSCIQGNTLVQAELRQLQTTLQSNPQSWLDRQILQGQQRELRLVQWLLEQGLQWGTPEATQGGTEKQDSLVITPQGSAPELGTEGSLEPALTSLSPLSPSSGAPSPSANPGVPLADFVLEPLPPHLENLLFDRFTAKLATPLRNLTPLPLEIEGLAPHKRRELLVLVVQCLGDRLTELRHSGVTLEQLREQHQEILEDLWAETITRFFGQYTIVTLQEQAVALVPRLLSYREPVRSSILRQIPLWLTVLQTVLFQEAVLVDGSPYRYDSPEALHRLEQLFENLVLQVANAVVQPLLNECSKVELIKQTYFHPRLLSTRQIERFRNDLSWKYRVLQNFEEPRNIYESRFALLVIEPDGIQRLGIYAPRQAELEALNLWQQSITLGLEFRDAAAPRLQSLTRWLGQGVVYVLTQVLGKAIGLVGRGIVQGLGSVWSDRGIPR